jgi:hypothetical protein
MELGVLNARIKMVKTRLAKPQYKIGATSSTTCTYWAERWATGDRNVQLQDDEMPVL